jgi:Lon protease-like protein
VTPPASLIIPLFPLQTVLFPGGALPLKIFEQRYMEMAAACLKAAAPFGVCLIAHGTEVGAPARPHAVGTLAKIAQWDMPQLGVLQVVAHGVQRFRILRHWAEPSGLLRGEIELLPEPAAQPVPDDAQALLPLLRAIVADLGAAGPPPPHRFDDAAWVGCRYCEVLPIPDSARQMLLELDDAGSRLEIVRKFLEQKGLL